MCNQLVFCRGGTKQHVPPETEKFKFLSQERGEKVEEIGRGIVAEMREEREREEKRRRK